MTATVEPGIVDETPGELYENAPSGYLTTLPDGTITRVNTTFLTLTGLTRGDVIGRRLRELLTVGGRMYHDTHLTPLLALQGYLRNVALTIQGASDRVLPVLLSANVRTDDDGVPLLVRITVSDATDRTSYERELLRARRTAESSEGRLRVLHGSAAAFAAAADSAGVLDLFCEVLAAEYPGAGTALWLADPETGVLVRHGNAVTSGEELAPASIDPAAVLPVPEAVRRGDVVSTDTTAAARDYPELAVPLAAARMDGVIAVPLVAEGQVAGAYQLTFRRRRTLTDDDLDLHRTLGRQAGEAIVRARLHEELQHRALHDPLTDVPNRALFTDRLEQALAASERSGSPVAAMFIDLDGFKAVNDALGHRAGDTVLLEAARRLRSALRPGDTLARLGGDEFAVLCEGAGRKEATKMAVRLEDAIRPPIVSRDRAVSVTVSIGVAVHDPRPERSTTSASRMLRDADAAMYRAKAAGKDQHLVYDATLDAELTRRAQVEARLRDAIADGGVVLHFQPVYDLRDRSVVGVEALCRLEDGDGGLLPPDQFIDVAEERGLIVPLGRRVLELACETVVGWDAEGARPVRLAVNVAAEQAARPEFAEEVLAVLAATGFPADRLLLELTESVLLDATPETLNGLVRLREHGIGVALDDFGTRYASLHYVQQFPLTALKIDRSFVAPLPAGRAERAIVRSVAQLAHDLSVSCTAEGIETEEQLDFLVGLGVLGQGYALARPMAAEACRELLGDR